MQVLHVTEGLSSIHLYICVEIIELEPRFTNWRFITVHFHTALWVTSAIYLLGVFGQECHPELQLCVYNDRCDPRCDCGEE